MTRRCKRTIGAAGPLPLPIVRIGHFSQHGRRRLPDGASASDSGHASRQTTMPSIGHSTLPGQSSEDWSPSGQRSRHTCSPFSGQTICPGQSPRISPAAPPATATPAPTAPRTARPSIQRFISTPPETRPGGRGHRHRWFDNLLACVSILPPGVWCRVKTTYRTPSVGVDSPKIGRLPATRNRTTAVIAQRTEPSGMRRPADVGHVPSGSYATTILRIDASTLCPLDPPWSGCTASLPCVECAENRTIFYRSASLT